MDRQKTGKQYDHSKFDDTPGQSYGAKRQCELLLRDQDALVAPSQKLQDICYNLQCKTPHRSGYYYAGPALEGTECGRAMVTHSYFIALILNFYITCTYF